MNRLLDMAAACGMTDVTGTPASPAAPAQAIGEAIQAWSGQLMHTRLPRGYLRPEHALAITWALGLFHATVCLCGRVDTGALLAVREALLSPLPIDREAQAQTEEALFGELMHRAADLALHGRMPGPALTTSLMRHSLLGILFLDEGSPEADSALAQMAQCIAAMEAAA